MSKRYVPFEDPGSNLTFIKSVQCMVILLTLIKVIFYMRIFDNLSFLVRMLMTVFLDLRYFLLVFALFLFGFGLMLTVIIDDVSYYTPIDKLGYLIISFRTAVGDFNIDSYAANSD